MKPAAFLAFSLLLCAMAAVPAQAQTVVNPRTVEFDPSADHNALTSDNQPVVQRYDLQIYTVGGTTPYSTANLGKPAPASDGKIRVDFSALVTPWPLPDGSYQARVAAIGPTGNASSDPSNTFAFQAQTVTCTYAVSPTALNFTDAGGLGTVTVTTAGTCSWTATTTGGTGWLTYSTSSGTGTGTVSFTVAANSTTSARTATVAAGGQAFTVTQAAAPCSYTLASTSLSVDAGGGTGSVAVTSGGGCAWTAVSNAAWVTIGVGGGTGNGSATFSVDTNTSVSPRSGTLTVAGQTYTVTQAAAACTYALSGTAQTFSEAPGSGSVGVTAAAGCSWTASSNAGWLTALSANGIGDGAVAFAVTANPTTTTRSAALTIAGLVYRVTQAGMACSYSLSASSQSFGATAGGGSVTLTAPAGCPWTATSGAAWVTAGTASGSGGATVPFTVAANTTTSPRSASLTIGNQPFTVSQAAGTCTYALSAAASSQFPQNGGTGSVGLTSLAGCTWTAVPSDTWITVAAASGSGSATVSYTVSKNPNPTIRTAKITIGGQVYSVSQAAANRPSAPKKVRLTVSGQ